MSGTEIRRGFGGWRWAPLATSLVLGLSAVLTASVGPVVVPTAVSAGTATSLTFVTPPATAAPGVALDPGVVVQAKDTDGKAAAGSVVLSLVRKGGANGDLTCTGTATGATTTTVALDAEGKAAFPGCAVDKGGSYDLKASLGALDATTALLVSGPAVLAFTTQPGDGVAGLALTTQPALQLDDAAGVDVTSGRQQEVGVVLAPGGTPGATLTCTPKTVATVAGAAQFAGCRVDRPGTYSLLAMAELDRVLGKSEPFLVTGGTATALRFTTQPVAGAAGGIAVQPVVSIVDAGGNTITDSAAPVALRVTGTSGTIACSPTDTVAGVAAFTGCSVSAPGTYTLTATSTGLTSAVSSSFTVTASGVAGLAFAVEPGNGSTGAALAVQPKVRLRDAGGSPASGAVTLSLTGGTQGAVLTCANRTMTSAADLATFSGCAVDTAGTGYRLLATSGTGQTTSAPFDVSAGAVDALRFTTTPKAGAGGADLGSITVEARDDIGAPAAATVRLALVGGLGTDGAALSCAGEVGTVGGTATFTGCSIDRAGAGYRLQATVASATTAIDTTDSFDIAVGPAAALVWDTLPRGGTEDDPADLTGGVTWMQQPAVSVRDLGGNRVATSTLSVGLSVGTAGAGLACTTNPLPVVRSTAFFAGCAVQRTGTYTLTATAGRLSTSTPLAIAAGPASQLLFTQEPGRGTPGGPLSTQPRVTVADAGGNPAAGTSGPVSLSLTEGTGIASGHLSCTSAPTAASVASFSDCAVSVDGGGYTLTASYGTLRAESLPFDVVPPATTGWNAPTAVIPPQQTFGSRLYANNPTTVADLVNTATGSLQTSVVDLEVAGVGQPLLLERTYNSLDTAGGAFGPGWSSVLDASVTLDAKGLNATVRGEDGQRVVFTRKSTTQTWLAPPGARSSLTCTAKTCTVVRYDGTRFEVAGKQLLSYLDANGQGLRFSYVNGLLSRVLVATSDPKKPQQVAVTMTGGLVTGLTTPAGRTVAYRYGDGLLTGVTDVVRTSWTYTYAERRLSRITDPEGDARLTVGYAGGKVASVLQGGSARRIDTEFTYALGGETRRLVALAGRRVEYTDIYSGNALLEQRLPLGRMLRYGYDGRANLTQVQDPAGWVQLMTYDAANHLLSQSSPLGGGASSVVRMTYDSQHRMSSQTDANGNVITYVYNGPNLASVRPPGPGEGATRLSYDSLGQLLDVTTPMGRQVYTNDAFGNAIRTVEQDRAGLPVNGAGSTATFDESGRTTSLTTAMGIESTWKRDAAGRVLSSTGPGGDATNTYDGAGDAVAATAGGESSTFTWDESSLTRTTTTDAGTVTQVYDPSGNVLNETSPSGAETRHTYDDLGRETTTASGGLTTRYTFDASSNVVAIDESDGGSLRQQFDAMKRLIRQVGDGEETRTSYDAVGNVIGTLDPSGGTTTRTYDAHGNPKAVSDAGGTTTYEYDLGDNVVRRTDGRGGVTTYTYDTRSRPVSETVGGNSTTYRYDLDGRLVRTTDPEGRVKALELDAAGNPLTTTYSGPDLTTIVVRQEFDLQGRRTQRDGKPVTYDEEGRVLQEAGFRYAYSPGKVVETYPSGADVTYGLGAEGSLMSVRTGTPGSPAFVEASYLRDGEGRATGLALSNGVLQTRAYDEDGNLLDQTVNHGGTTLAHDAYSWDGRGNRTSQRSSALGETVESGYAYEQSGRLAGARSQVRTGAAAEVLAVGVTDLATPPAVPSGTADETTGAPAIAALPLPKPGVAIAAPAADLEYDAVGNRTTAAGRSWTHGPADEVLTDSAGVTWTYDRSGAVTGRTDEDGRTTRYEYDAAARLSAVTSGGKTVRYGYDGDGNRTSRVEDGVETTYTWSPFGSLPQLATETTDGRTTTYLHGEGPVAARTGDDVLFFHLDPLGSTNHVSDADGALVASYRYSAFGEMTSIGDRADEVDLLFHAQQLDRFSGLYNMRARQYDPEMGRFTQREPAATPVGVPLVSAYAFVGNQPTAKTDPTGRTVSTATVFAGQSTDDANTANNAKLAAKGTQITLKVVSKVGGYSAALASASASGTQLTKAAKIGAKLKFAGAQLAIIGIGLQTLVAVENCRSGPVEKCVASVTGLAINVAFTVGCTFITSGVGSFACAMCGAALGIGLEYVIAEFGPEIVDGLIDAWEAAAPWVSDAAAVTAAAFVAFGDEVARGTTEAVATVTVAFETAYADAVDVLTDAGLSAVQMGELLVAALGLGVQDTLAALTTFGYSIADTAVVLGQVFEQGYEEAAALLSTGFAVATTELAAALQTAYALADDVLVDVLAGLDVAVSEIAAAFDVLNEALSPQGIAELLLGAAYGLVEVGSVLEDALAQTNLQIALVLVELDYVVADVAGVLRDVGDELGLAAASTLKLAGFAAEQVAAALVSVWDDTAAAAAEALEAAGYAVAQVALGLKQAYAATAAQVTQLLKDVEFTSVQIAGVLSSLYTQGAAGATRLLRDVGFAAAEVGEALQVTYQQVAEGAAQLLEDVGYTFTEIGEALETAFDQTATLAAGVLRGIGASAAELAAALQVAFGQTALEMAKVFDSVGIALGDVALALQLVYGQTAAVLAQTMEDAGYLFAEIGTALHDAFGTAAAELSAVLQSIGAAATDVVNILTAELGTLATDVLNGVLVAAGYAASAIDAVGGALASFGNDVEDFFSGLF